LIALFLDILRIGLRRILLPDEPGSAETVAVDGLNHLLTLDRSPVVAVDTILAMIFSEKSSQSSSPIGSGAAPAACIAGEMVTKIREGWEMNHKRDNGDKIFQCDSPSNVPGELANK